MAVKSRTVSHQSRKSTLDNKIQNQQSSLEGMMPESVSIVEKMQQAFLDSASAIVGKEVQDIKASLSVKMEVIEELDAGTHKYQVQYEDNNLIAYGMVGTSYSPGQIVQVLVPSGDFSEKLVIYDLYNAAAEAELTEEVADTYILEENLITSNGDPYKDIKELHSWKEEKILIPFQKDFKDIFFEKTQDRKNFKMSFKVRTDIDGNHRTTGNYGMTLILPFRTPVYTIDPNTNKKVIQSYKEISETYTLDIHTMSGSVYDFKEYTYQEYNIDLKEDWDFDIDPEKEVKCFLFVKDFNYTTDPIADDGESRISGDILIKDIFFGPIRYLTEEELSGNSLSLNVSGGKYFVENSIKKIISPEYRVKGKVVKSLEGYECYWFVENVAIKVGSSGYNRIGGQGWECLNEQVIINYDSAGNSVYDWVTDQYSLTVEPTDVKNELEYKCVIVNNKGDLVQSRVTLKNLNSQYKIKINTSTGLYNYIPNIGEANIIVSIETSIKENYINTYWQRFDKDGKLVNTNFSLLRDFVKISGGDTGPYVYETEVSIPVKEIDTSTTIECTLSKEELDQTEGVTRYTNLGTVSISISATETPDYRLKIYNGDVCFKYDTNGNSPRLDAANYDGPLSTRVTQIDGLTWRLFKDTGQELNDEEYSLCKWEWKIPKSNTLITYQSGKSDIELSDYYIESGNGYNPATDSGIIYDIANKYDLKKTNNTFILTVSFGEKTLSSTVTPTFLKDGANGTNGTRWSAAIKYHSSEGGEYGYGARDANGNPIKFQLAYYNEEWYIVSKEGLIKDVNKIEEEKTKDYLTISIYKDGEEIETPNEGTEEKYSIVWEVFDEKELNSLITVASSGSYNENCQIDIKKDEKKQTPVPFNDDSCNIVRAIVTVGNNSSIGSEQQDDASLQGDAPLNTTEVIYAYYPIEIISVNGIIDKVSRIPNLDYGFDQVIYANDGTNPQYDNSHPFQVTSFNINNSELDSFDKLEWSVNEKGNLKIKEKKNMTCSCVPFSKFESGQSKNYIKVEGEKRKDIATKIKELQGKIRIINDDKRWYENVPYYICNFCNEFNEIFNESKIILSNSDNKQILEYRYQALQKIGQPSKENVKAKEFYSILEELFNECKENNIKIPKFTWQENEDPEKGNYYSSFNDSEYKKLVDKTRQEAYNYIIDAIPSAVSGIDTEIIEESYIKGNIKNIYNDYIIYRDIINTSISGLNSIDKSSDLYLYSIAEKIINYPDSMNGYDEGGHHLIKEQQMQILFDSLSLYKAFLQKPSGKEKDERYDKEGCEDFYSYSSIFQVLYRILSLVQKYNLETLNKIYAKKCDVLIEEKNEIEKELEQYKSCQITSFTLIKPILFLTNYYGFSELNGWDGNKLYINENKDYIIAPKVGAGQKENSKFTGMFMGVLKTSDYDKIGLLGLSGGEQTLFLNARNGSAIFGKSSSGQIVIDPTQSKALLYNSGFFEKYNNNGLPTSYGESNWKGEGMLIDLSTPEIRFGNGNFVVNSEGKITALGGGFIGGWNITDTTIESGGKNSQKKIIIDSNGEIKVTTRIDEHGEEIVVKKEVIYSNETKPKIYSEGHDVLITRDKDGHLDINKKGFYLSSDGIGIGDAFLVDANPDGEEITGQRLYLGKLNSKSRYWKISANETKNSSGNTIINSYISYNTEALDPIKKNSNNEELVGESLPEDPSSPGYVPSSSHDSGSDDEVTTPSESDSLPIDDEVEKPGGRIPSDDNDIGMDDSDEGWGDYDSETGEIHQEIKLVEDVSAPGRGGEGGLPRINYKDKEGKIYEYVYNSNSVYIGTDGLRIGNRFRVGPSEEGGFIDKLELGQLTANHWTIKSNGTDSYIAFGTTERHFETDKNVITIDEKNAETSSVYIGTDGIRLGNKFAIDINGNVLSNFIVANAGGEIGGWTLDGKCLRSKETTDNKGWIKLDPVSGKISGGKGNKTKWYINASGKAYFQDFEVKKTDNDDTVKINTGGWIIGQNTIQDNNNTVFITATEGGDGYIKLGDLYIGGANVGSDSIGLNTKCFLKFESEVIKYVNKEIAVRGVYTVKKNKDEAGNPSGDIVGYVKI